MGGEFNKDYDMSYGPLTLQMIKQFNFDHAFFSTNGVSLKTGEVNIFEFSIGAVKREIMKRLFRIIIYSLMIQNLSLKRFVHGPIRMNLILSMSMILNMI